MITNAMQKVSRALRRTGRPVGAAKARSGYPLVKLRARAASLGLLLCLGFSASAEVSRIEVTSQQTLGAEGVAYRYEQIDGVMYFTLDPRDPDNRDIHDIQHAELNSDGLVEFSADFRLLVPPAELANGTLVYVVNNRGGAGSPPGNFPDDPLYGKGFTYLWTGWINELEAGGGRLLLNAPLVGSAAQVITGTVRYEVITGSDQPSDNIAGPGHLAYEPTENGLANATLSHRVNRLDPRMPIERSGFDLAVEWSAGRNQPLVTLSVDGGLQAGHIYELIYEARNPVLAGAGMAGIRDSVALLRHGAGDNAGLAQELAALGLPAFQRTIGIGNSQSGRLLRMFLYDGFNADLDGHQVFDGVIPYVAASGMGMFNNRFAMPTRTNGQHENDLYPNDLFPFTYGISVDPFSGREDGILRRAMASNTVPKVMHLQTSNEYWLRGGSLPHTDARGAADAEVPDNVRFYTIGGSQHSSGNGMPRQGGGGQLPPNPNLWTPIRDTLLVAMHEWIAAGTEPPASRYPRIADGSLVPSHLPDGRINPQAWHTLAGINQPKDTYRVAAAEWGDRWLQERIIDRHPQASDKLYGVLVPAVDVNNNDLAASTILPPLTQVPIATFVAWNLRAPATGADTELARLTGGYIPFARSAAESTDSRATLEGLYASFEDYLAKYEAATDRLIEEGYLLPDYKAVYMDIANANRGAFGLQ